jgi:hypothetical protein
MCRLFIHGLQYFIQSVPNHAICLLLAYFPPEDMAASRRTSIVTLNLIVDDQYKLRFQVRYARTIQLITYLYLLIVQQL